MRVRIAFGAWWLVLTLAWMAAVLPWDTGGGTADAAFWWQLRQHALYLSGIWAIGMMSLGMLLSLRQHWLEPLLGVWIRCTACTNGWASGPPWQPFCTGGPRSPAG